MNTKYRIHDRIQDTIGYRLHHTEHRIQDTGYSALSLPY